MSRYRPPAPKKSPYITAEGMRTLEAEQKALWPRRREVVAALSAAAAEGDRSENAEYIYRKKELGELDRRIRYLQKRLPDLTVVSEKPTSSDRIYFGATVHLQDEDEKISIYRIVGPDEHDHEEHYISVDSPLARSLLKRERGEEVTVEVPGGIHHYLITDLSY
jgi:transcription elongation factor GreB